MFQNRKQIFWYILGGFLLILAGLVTISGTTFPYALPVLLVVAGGIIIAAGLLGFTPAFPALVVFLAGTVALGLAASGPYGIIPYSTTETRELTIEQAPNVRKIDLSCTVSTGAIKVSFTSNATQIYRIVFTKYSSIFHQPKINFDYVIENENLIVNASSSTVSVDITVNQNLRSTFNLNTTTGSIRMEVPTTAPYMEDATLITTTGEVWVNITNTASLKNLVAKTTTGQVEAHIKSSYQSRSANAQLSTTTGRVKLNLNITNIESDIQASTTIGKIDADVIGFTVLDSTQTSFHAQTPNYGWRPTPRLDISATATTGNLDITAYHK